MDIAHLEAGRVASVEETFDLRRLIDQVVEDHSELALVNENQLSIDWDENLETLIATDPHKVGQIISNLVNNALKFTKRGQITVQVDRHISPHAEFMIELRVTDTGIGIPDKFLKHIFDDSRPWIIPIPAHPAGLDWVWGSCGAWLPRRMAQWG